MVHNRFYYRAQLCCSDGSHNAFDIYIQFHHIYTCICHGTILYHIYIVELLAATYRGLNDVHPKVHKTWFNW